TSRENNQIASSLKTDPVPLTSVLPHQDSSAPDAQWRRLTATGHYRPEGEVLVRLRVDDGDASYEVLTPFAVDGGPIVLVNRGYLKAGNGVPPFAAPPPGTVTITGRLRDAEPIMSGKQPFKQDRIQQVYSINTTQISQVTGVPLAGDYLQLVDGQPGGLGVIALPHLDAGPFLSYGIQWIAFGIVAPIGLGYFVFAEIRQRRLEKAQSDSRAAAAAGPDPEEPAAPLTAEEKLADRYGRRR
ncbi:SURF1 family protein, partial [Mycolicibacterium sp. CBMA 361]